MHHFPLFRHVRLVLLIVTVVVIFLLAGNWILRFFWRSDFAERPQQLGPQSREPSVSLSSDWYPLDCYLTRDGRMYVHATGTARDAPGLNGFGDLLLGSQVLLVPVHKLIMEVLRHLESNTYMETEKFMKGFSHQKCATHTRDIG